MPTADAPLLRTTDGSVALLTINRPDSLNALTPAVMDAIADALDEIGRDSSIRAVVITGTGTRSFSTGFDLDGLDMPDRTDAIVASTRRNFDVLMKIWNLRVPVVAAVNGYAVAAGTSLALICDIVVASETASFGEPEVRHYALSPLLLMPWFSSNVKKANYHYYTGDMFDAAGALEMGLVNEVVPAEQVVERAMAIAARIAMVAPFAVEMTKESMRRSYEIQGFTSALHQHRLMDTILLASNGIPERDRFFELMAAGDMRGFLRERDGAFKPPPTA